MPLLQEHSADLHRNSFLKWVLVQQANITVGSLFSWKETSLPGKSGIFILNFLPLRLFICIIFKYYYN